MVEQIAYVTSRWGAPTQTFVRREATVVAEEVPVRALSLKRPVPASSDATVPCTHLGPLATLGGFARAVVRHPLRVTGVILTVLRRSRPRNVLPLLAASVTGVAWAGVGAVRPGMWLHAHFGWVSAASAWAAARVSGVRYSVVLHAFELHRAALVDEFTPVPLREAAQVFTISERDRADLADRMGVDAAVLRMGVPRSWLAELDEPHEREDDLVVAVGSLVEKKGHDVLIEAIARSDSKWRVEIIGEGPERDRLERLIDARGVRDRVALLGALSEQEVRDRLSRASVACLACVESADGNRDGIPVALMEAMALGLPVVSTRVGAIPELVDGAGILVTPGDVDALAAALDSLTDEKWRHEVATRGRRRIMTGGWIVDDQADAVVAAVRAIERQRRPESARSAATRSGASMPSPTR